jgi:hypothetical protein
MMLAATLINWAELWKIVLAALIGGTGVAIVFGLLLLGISRGKTAAAPAARFGLYTFSGLCAIFVVGVAAVGIYAMTQKPSPAKPGPRHPPSLPTGAGNKAPDGGQEPRPA